jgi:uracil-DNA glycosylase
MSRLLPLLEEVRACRLCEAHLPLGPRPVVRAGEGARLLIVGQAPGTRVHETGIPWNDPSGDRLRDWLQMDREAFYDENRIAIMPMGFCYPGRGKGGDLPPRPECAPQWHERLLAELPDLQLTLLVGQYAQKYYLPEPGKTLSLILPGPWSMATSRCLIRARETGYGCASGPGSRKRCCRCCVNV